jgi:Fe2+ or Zn2+ uptake regulation protein
MQNHATQQFIATLRANHSKATPDRLAIFAALLHARQAQRPLDIASQLRDVNFTTVYRNLDLFVRLKIARQVPRGFKTYYELGDNFNPHHHHLTCEKCGRTVAFDSAELERLIAKISHQCKMLPTGHHIELYGICRHCRRKSRHCD